MNMKKIFTGVVLLCLVLSAAACGRGDRAMPLTRENIMQYRDGLVASQNGITVKEREEAGKSAEGARELFAMTFVKPMKKLGYSYDKTVRSYAEKLAGGNLADVDQETRTQAQGMILMAKATADFALKNGFITGDTKQVLDRINVK